MASPVQDNNLMSSPASQRTGDPEPPPCNIPDVCPKPSHSTPAQTPVVQPSFSKTFYITMYPGFTGQIEIVDLTTHIPTLSSGLTHETIRSFKSLAQDTINTLSLKPTWVGRHNRGYWHYTIFNADDDPVVDWMHSRSNPYLGTLNFAPSALPHLPMHSVTIEPEKKPFKGQRFEIGSRIYHWVLDGHHRRPKEITLYEVVQSDGQREEIPIAKFALCRDIKKCFSIPGWESMIVVDERKVDCLVACLTACVAATEARRRPSEPHIAMAMAPSVGGGCSGGARNRGGRGFLGSFCSSIPL